MTDHTELKQRAEYALEHAHDSYKLRSEIAFDRAATPSAVLALIAELDDQALQTRAAREVAMESQTAILSLIAERDQLKAENERLAAKVEQVRSRSVSLDHSPGGVIPNALDAWGRVVPQHLPYDFSGNPGANATQYCNGWNDAGGYWKAHCVDIQAERDQLRAEVAGLRTGYEAYEQVNAELKAENERLRQIVSDSATSCGAAVSVECSLDFMAHLPVEIFSVISKLRNALAECTNSLQGEMLQKFGGQLPEDMHPVTRREYDRDIAEVSGYRAALGQGEQS